MSCHDEWIGVEATQTNEEISVPKKFNIIISSYIHKSWSGLRTEHDSLVLCCTIYALRLHIMLLLPHCPCPYHPFYPYEVALGIFQCFRTRSARPRRAMTKSHFTGCWKQTAEEKKRIIFVWRIYTICRCCVRVRQISTRARVCQMSFVYTHNAYIPIDGRSCRKKKHPYAVRVQYYYETLRYWCRCRHSNDNRKIIKNINVCHSYVTATDAHTAIKHKK